MNRWLVRGFVRSRNRLSEFQRDSGQGAVEYLGIVVVIAVVIGILASTTDIGDTILDAILAKITDISNAGG